MQSQGNFFRAVPAISAAEMLVNHARPRWNTLFLPMQLVATSFAGAIGLARVFNRAPDRDVTLDNSLRRLLVLALALVLMLRGGWLFVSMSAISAARNAAFKPGSHESTDVHGLFHLFCGMNRQVARVAGNPDSSPLTDSLVPFQTPLPHSDRRKGGRGKQCHRSSKKFYFTTQGTTT